MADGGIVSALPVAAIGAGASLLSSLLGINAQKRAQIRQMKLEGVEKSAESQRQAQAGLSQGQQEAFNQLMGTFQGVLS